MRSPLARALLALALIAVGLAASGALLVDYTTHAPVFCAEGGGCEALRETVFAMPFGVPLPAIGLLAFFSLGMLAVMRGPRVRLANLLAAGLGGLVGLGLLVVQVVVGHFCPFCTATDIAAVALAVLAVDRREAEWDPPKGAVAAVLMSSGLALATVAPFLWANSRPEGLPRVIARELAQTPKGQVTIVDFVDYQCPFCRQMQARLAPALAAEKGRFRVVRKMVPLTRIHEHALDAAKASCCADVLGKGDAMAEALFETKVEDLTPEGCEHLATSLGLSLDAYRACLASPETEARLARDRHDFDEAAAKGDGLPLMWVGTNKMMGARDEATIARVLGDAIAHAGS